MNANNSDAEMNTIDIGMETDTASDQLLELIDVNASVEGFQVTHDVNLTVNESEAVGLVGRNGAGKTTTFRSIMGAAEVLSGSIRYNGENLTNLDSDLVPKRGIGYQPEDRGLFTGMSVEENIRLPIWTSGNERNIEDEDKIIDDIFNLFTEIEQRRNTNVENLSGGEGKMTAIGRALALQPDLLLLDEPLEGLAPIVVENLKEYIRKINDQGVSILVAESNATHLPDIVDRMYAIERGEIVASGDPETLAKNEEIQQLFQG